MTNEQLAKVKEGTALWCSFKSGVSKHNLIEAIGSENQYALFHIPSGSLVASSENVFLTENEAKLHNEGLCKK